MAKVAQPRSQVGVPERAAVALPPGAATESSAANRRSSNRKWWSAFALLVWIAVVALGGCSNEPAPRDTHNAISDSGDISSFFYQMLLWLDVAIGAAVIAVWAWTLVRFKRAAGDDTLPTQNHGDAKMEMIWTAIPTVIVIAITVPMLVGVFRLAKRPDQNQQIIEIDVTGKQWWWEFQYKNGSANGLHTANEVHVQANTAVVMNMTSSDVIHAWWVPRLTGKRDATPGRSYPLYFTAREPGIYDGQCAELCGASHALMGTKLFVHPPAKEVEVDYNGKKVKLDSYETWVKEQLAPVAAPAGPDLERGAKLFKDKTCPTCHLVKGLEGAESASPSMTTGPNLTHVGSRMTIAANTMPNTPENLAKWILDPQGIKPGAKMTKIAMSPDEAKAIAAFLTSLK